MMETKTGGGRLVFLDNVRYFIIFFVILQHVALVYMAYRGEAVVRGAFNLTVGLTDVFMMPVMFFIAGYFALPSIVRHGTAGFIAGKVKRIWLPWLAGVLLLIPVSNYFMYLVTMDARGETPIRYMPYWLTFMKSAAGFPTGYTSSHAFSHKHMWFLSNLFVFFLVFAAVWEIYRRMSKDRQDTVTRAETPLIPSPVTVMAGAAVLSGLLFFLASYLYQWGYHALLVAGLVHFEPTRLMFYIVYFPIGVYAYSRGWFGENARLGSLKLWTALCVLLLAAYSYVSLFVSFEMTAMAMFLMSMFRSALTVASLGALVTVGFSKCNRPAPVDAFFARNAYIVYIIHYPFHAVIAALMIALPLPIIVKAGILFVATTAVSYLASEYAVRRHAYLSAAAAVLVNALMLVVL